MSLWWFPLTTTQIKWPLLQTHWHVRILLYIHTHTTDTCIYVHRSSVLSHYLYDRVCVCVCVTQNVTCYVFTAVAGWDKTTDGLLTSTVATTARNGPEWYSLIRWAPSNQYVSQRRKNLVGPECFCKLCVLAGCTFLQNITTSVNVSDCELSALW